MDDTCGYRLDPGICACCKCIKNCESRRCSCVKASLKCSELCQCSDCQNRSEGCEEIEEIDSDMFESCDSSDDNSENEQ